MSLTVAVIRTGLKVLPPPVRERAAARLFMRQPRYPEPEREASWRAKGEEIMVAGHHAVRFGDGTPVLLMHGWAGRGLQLAAFIGPLLDRGHAVIALDGPNHGRNEGGIGALPTFAAFMEAAIRDQAPVAIIAHSLGAAAAIVAAARTGYTGRIICLGGPPETAAVFTRARRFMGLPESGRPRFEAALAAMFDGIPFDDVLDIEGQAGRLQAKVSAVLARDDEEIPVEESRAIVAAAGGHIAVIDCTHRSVMWDPAAVAAALEALDGTTRHT